MRIESSVTSLSWISLGATEGFNRLSFGLRVAHYDPPPPEVLGDLDELSGLPEVLSVTVGEPG
jgi:hypothetical protein